jgi:hypothetical protein
MSDAQMGQIKQALEKQRCDRTKQKIKKLLVQIDDTKTGLVKLPVFKQLL